VEPGSGKPGDGSRLPDRTKRNVLVHKFVCQGTVEEKIDAMIETKKALSDELLTGSSETKLTEMKDDELLRLVALDLAAAMKD